MTLDDWLSEKSIALHREARRTWRRSDRLKLYQEAREYAGRAIEAKQLREMLREMSPDALSVIEVDRLERING